MYWPEAMPKFFTKLLTNLLAFNRFFPLSFTSGRFLISYDLNISNYGTLDLRARLHTLSALDENTMKAVCASEASESAYAMRSHEIVHLLEKILDLRLVSIP